MSEISFLDNIKLGLDKADQASQNLEEIQGVFSNLSSDLMSVTNNQIYSEIISKTEYLDDSFTAMAMALAHRKFREYQALTLKNRTNKNLVREIAEIGYHVDGYPIRIIIKGNTTSYHDKDSLIKGLRDLVSSTDVGKAIKSLIE